jgi:molybdate transport system regulatory protein
LGPGKIALLETIDRTGSLSQAARVLGMSYRRGWQLLASLNTSFREPVVVTATGGRGGGGARVTPFGKELISRYRAFEDDAQARAARAFKGIAAKARRGARSARGVPVVRLGGRPGAARLKVRLRSSQRYSDEQEMT